MSAVDFSGDDAVVVPFSELASLLEHFALSSSCSDLSWVADYLSKLTNRKKPWSPNYLKSCLSGSIVPGKPLRQAVTAALIIADGTNVVQASWSEVLVFSPPESDNPVAAQLPGKVLLCSVPECMNRFVPNSGKRTKCYVCSPPKYK